MKVSRAWLQKFFDTELPDVEHIAHALTFHSSEVEEIVGDMLEVKILPDRAGYALSHRGVAYELAAALGMPMTHDPLTTLEMLNQVEADNGFDYSSVLKPVVTNTSAAEILIEIEDPEKCARFMATLITGVTVGPSPDWLRLALESVGQRSINNIVDATNYVMLNVGQPLHAYDAAKLSKNEKGLYSLAVRASRAGEKVTTLSNETFNLPEGITVIADSVADVPLGVAGVKGGKTSEITESTTDLLIEAATFDAVSTRKSAQALKLFTDASLRYQNGISPALAAYGMRDVVALILSIAGGEVIGAVDVYPNPIAPLPSVTVTRDTINGILGSDFSTEEMAGALRALLLPYGLTGDECMVLPPFYRNDLVRAEDIAEEVGRVLGYDRIDAQELPAMKVLPDQKHAQGIERLKDFLIDHGYTEISTQAFAAEGERRVLKPMQQDKPALRTTLTGGVEDALARGIQSAPRILGPGRDLLLFEIGSVFGKENEQVVLGVGYRQVSGKYSPIVLEEIKSEMSDMLASLGQALPDIREKSEGILELTLEDSLLIALGEGYGAREVVLSSYTSFSPYPFALRDVAVWTPRVNSDQLPTEQSTVETGIAGAAGELLVRLDLFDRFEKDDRISYAFRLVFQSNQRTLSDADLDPIMEKVTLTLQSNEGWVVR
jgi:phenylalanyl-tRNA synthetase beta chain